MPQSSYLGIFRHKAYSGLFRHIQHPLQSSNIHNLAIFWGLAYLEREVYLKPCETLTTRDIQNPAIGHYSAIFRQIQSLVQRLHTQKPGILEILEYSNASIIASPLIQKPVYQRKFTNIQNSNLFKIEFFCKNN